MPIYLTEADVDGLVDMPAAIDVLEEAFAAKATGDALNRPRLRLPLVDGNYNVMAASWMSRGVVGQKSFTAGPAGVTLDVVLYDTGGAGLLAIIEGRRLTALRTGAASGLSAKYLARRGGPVAMIGTGIQAVTQLEAIVAATDAPSARVHSRSADGRAAFAARMSERLGIPVTPADSVEACIAGAAVIVTVTTAVEPILRGAWLERGVHIVAAGSNSWVRAELDLDAVRRSDRIVVDDIEQARTECGDLMRAVEVGRFSWSAAVELADIVAGRTPGRQSDAEITLFESQGIAIEDVALAERVYRRALERGVGARVP